MAKRLKLARCSGADAGEDRLSSLPDEILINNILSLLPTREAQRTSILARSWRHLWSYVPRLDLDGSQKLVHLPPPCRKRKVETLDMESATKYAEWVDRVTDAYMGTTALSHFRVSCRLGNSFTRKIDSWLEFSLRQGVEVLELECCDIFYERGEFWPYSLRLSIEPTRFPNIRLLKSLTLRGLTISSDSLEGLLSGCEFLETLQLSLLFGLTNVNVTGPVSRLKHIHIDTCFQLRSIRILSPTPDLVSLAYPRCEVDTVHIEHAPRLVYLQTDLAWRFYEFPPDTTLHPRYLSQLEALKLAVILHRSAVSLQNDLDRAYDFPVLGRLKHLEWTQTDCVVKGLEARWVASLISKAPLLRHLTLDLSCRGKARAKPASLREELDKMHLQLPPVIEIAGFEARKEDCEVVLHLIKDSPSLEKLIIDCRDPYRRECRFDPYKCSEKTVNKWKGTIKEVIEPQLPSKAKLVVI